MSSGSGFGRLQQAFDAWEEFQASGGTDVEGFLAAHESLRDLLEPLVGAPIEPAESAGREERTLGGDFRIRREIGRGGMGRVFEAQQISLDRRVAVKTLHTESASSPHAVARFKQEASTAARLEHDGIVDVYAVGSDDNVHWFAMELVDGAPLDAVVAHCREVPMGELRGRTLLQAVESARRSNEESLRIDTGLYEQGHIEAVTEVVARVADALEHARSRGVIHRDVKPSNILLRVDGRVVLTDFGLAREEALPSMTRSGEFAGTPYYVAPEQAQGRREEVDHRADLFSLGVTLYEMLTLRRPFEGHNSPEVLAAIIGREPADPRRYRRGLSNDLVAIVMKALEKRPDNRYQSAAEFAEDLRRFARHLPVNARAWTRRLRFSRWLRREPAKAALAIALTVGVPTVGGLGGYLLINRETFAAGAEVAESKRLEEELTAGFVAITENFYERARESFARARLVRPDSVEAVWGYVHALAQTGASDEALATLDELPDLVNRSAALRRAREDCLLRLGERDRALAMERVEPEDALGSFLEALSWRSYSIGNPNDEAARNRALRHAKHAVMAAPVARPVYHAVLARTASSAKQMDLALATANAMLEIWPDLDVMWGTIGYVFSFHDLERALDAFDRALKYEPGHPPTVINKAIVLRKLGRPDEATALFEDALNGADPDAVPARIYDKYAGHLATVGRVDDALAAYERAWEIAPRAQFAINHGATLMRRNRQDEACKVYARGVDAFPDHYLLLLAYGVGLYQADDLERAVEILRRACAARGEVDRSDAVLGSTLFRLERYDEASEVFERCLEWKPHHASMWFNFGNSLVWSERFEDAIAPLRRAIALEPKHAKAAITLATALSAAGHTEEAVGAFRRSIVRFPAHVRQLQEQTRRLARRDYARETARALAGLLVDLRPDDQPSHELLVGLLGREGDHGGLRAELDRWVRQRPDDPDAWDALADHCEDPAVPELWRAPAAAAGARARAAEIRAR